jgi:hypothetical protein
MRTLIAGKTYWFTADKTEVVEDGDERARFLLARKGSPVDPTVAEMYGLETEDAPGETYPAPGANVPQGVTSAAHMAATRAVTAEVATNRETATDASTSRQVAHAVEGEVSRRLGVPASRASQASADHEAHSMSGSDLLTGAEAAKAGGGGNLGGAYEDRTEGQPEAGANPTAADAPKGGAKPAPNSRTRETPAPQGVGGGGLSPKTTADAQGDASADAAENLQRGTQEYAGSAGVAITPEGTERVDKTKPPPEVGAVQPFGTGSALGTGGGGVPQQVGGGTPQPAPTSAPTLAQARGEAAKQGDDTLAGASDKAKEGTGEVEVTKPPQGIQPPKV